VSWASAIVGVITAGVLAGGLAACGTPGASAHLPSPARASATADPVRVQPNVVGWSGMMQRPDHIYVGMGGAPIARQLTWRSWGGAQAWATGQLDIFWPQRGPISGWHPTTFPVRVRLQDIATRDGQRAYRKMTDYYVNRHGVTKVLSFTFSVLPGGSVPAWNRPGGTLSRPKPPGLA
jgi:hypothetical protein